MRTTLLILAGLAVTITIPCLICLTQQIKQYERDLKATKTKIRTIETELQEIDKVLCNSTVISSSSCNDWHYICYSCKYINYCQESSKKPDDENNCADYVRKGSDYDEEV